MQTDTVSRDDFARLTTPIDACPLCSSRDSSVVRNERHDFPPDERFRPYAEIPITVRRCGSCDFAFVDALPSDPTFYVHSYGKDYDWPYEFDFHGKGAIHAHIRRQLSGYVRSGKLLDVGAWCGTLLWEFRDAFEVHGVEISPGAAAHARSKGLDVRSGTFDGVDLSDLTPLDVITLIDVLEHLPDPGKMIDRARALLRPGGVVVIKVPHFYAQAAKQTALQRLGLSRVGVAQNYSHINHFSPRSLRAALEARGFDVLDICGAEVENWNLRAPVPAKLKARRLLSNAVRALGTKTLNGLSRAGIPSALNIQVIARRL